MGVAYLELRVAIHATEDEDKVMRAISNVVPGSLLEEAEREVDEFKGHYGNRIKVVTFRVRERAGEALAHLLSRLDPRDRSHVLSTLEERVGPTGSLHLRLSKQDAFLGRLVVFEGDDVVKVTVGFRGGRRRALEEYRDLLGAPG